jgi:hypothetical protein
LYKKKKINVKPEKSYAKFILMAVLVLAVGYYLITKYLDSRGSKDLNKNITTNTTPKTEMPEPPFKKQGDLSFLSGKNKKEIRKIDIEIAANDSSRMMGLMFRKSMDDAKGMLFIFDKSEEHSFWMKNTVMSLDIIFINENKEIVKIHKNTKPFSTESLPSIKPSMYVVEVQAGFTDKYGIKEGDKIDFSKL